MFGNQRQLNTVASEVIIVPVGVLHPTYFGHKYALFTFSGTLLVLFATDEDYCIVVKTFGFHILS